MTKRHADFASFHITSFLFPLSAFPGSPIGFANLLNKPKTINQEQSTETFRGGTGTSIYPNKGENARSCFITVNLHRWLLPEQGRNHLRGSYLQKFIN